MREMPNITRSTANVLSCHRLLQATAALLSAAPSAALGQGQAPAAPALMPIVMALAAVLALIPIAVWLLKRLGAGTTVQASGLQVVSQLPLGTGQRVVVLQAGDRWLLLGVTGGSITRLGSLPRPPVEATAANAAPISPPSFAALLAGIGRGNRTSG